MARTLLTEDERQARRADALGRLEQATEALLTSEGWRSWLRTRVTLHSYSARNALLLCQQAAERGFEPSHVAGFRAWLKLGRAVRKGEHALKVFAPIRRRGAEPDEPGGTDEPVDGAEPRVVAFTLASVFDTLSRDRGMGLSSGAVGRWETLEDGGRDGRFAAVRVRSPEGDEPVPPPRPFDAPGISLILGPACRCRGQASGWLLP